MDAQTISLTISAAIAVVALIGVVGVLAVVLPKLKNQVQGYPLEVEVERALLPYLFEAICGAYKASETAVTDLGTLISGTDKKKLADFMYSLLPDAIGTFPISVVKAIVTKERFEEMIQNAFDQFMAFYKKNQASYDEAFAKWRAEYEAGLPGQTPGQTPSAPTGYPNTSGLPGRALG